MRKRTYNEKRKPIAVVESNCFIFIAGGQMYFFGATDTHIMGLQNMLGIHLSDLNYSEF